MKRFDPDALLEAAEAVRDGRPVRLEHRVLVERTLIEARAALIPAGQKTKSGKQAEGAELLMRYYKLSRKAALLHVVDDKREAIDTKMLTRVAKALDRLRARRKQRTRRR